MVCAPSAVEPRRRDGLGALVRSSPLARVSAIGDRCAAGGHPRLRMKAYLPFETLSSYGGSLGTAKPLSSRKVRTCVSDPDLSTFTDTVHVWSPTWTSVAEPPKAFTRSLLKTRLQMWRLLTTFPDIAGQEPSKATCQKRSLPCNRHFT